MKKQFAIRFYEFCLIFIVSFYLLLYFLNQLYNLKTSDITINKTKDDVNRTRIFCIILTQPSNLFTKAKAVNQTWAKECDKYYFIARIDYNDINKTTELSTPLPVLQPAHYAFESYFYLTDKMFQTYKYIYSKHIGYDWYLKTDDDTFIFMDNLRDFLKNKDSSSPISFGRNWNHSVSSGYESGGAGYVLSNEAMRRLGGKLNKDYTFCINTGIEDIDTARCLRQLDVESGWTRDEKNRQLFHAYNFRKELIIHGINSFSESSISFHYIGPTEMYKLNYLWENYKIQMILEGANSTNFMSIVYSMLLD